MSGLERRPSKRRPPQWEERAAACAVAFNQMGKRHEVYKKKNQEKRVLRMKIRGISQRKSVGNFMGEERDKIQELRGLEKESCSFVGRGKGKTNYRRRTLQKRVDR